MPSKAVTAARNRMPAGVANTPAYTVPANRANVASPVIARGEVKALSPIAPLPTLKEA